MSAELPDFDTLLKIAQEDPERLETIRQQATEDLITSAPEAMQRRLRGLQFQIDAQRAIAKTPTASCMKISQMMYESFYELRQALNEATGNAEPLIMESEASAATAKIVPFRSN